MKKILFACFVLVSINGNAQFQKNDFFGKWRITNIETKILENDTQKSTFEKTALKKLVSSKFSEGNYFIELSAKKIIFVEDKTASEKYDIKSMKLVDGKIEITFDKYKKTFTLKNKGEGECDGVTHYLKKE
jgi:LAS superfamily LD-carboxypeptidase LdcB